MYTQARRRWWDWGGGGGAALASSPSQFFAEQQNIFSKIFQFVTIKFLVFFRTNKKKESE